MAMDNQQSHEEITSHFGGYNAKIKKRRKSILCWRAAFCSGMLFLMMGLVAILVGFLVPKRNEIYDIQEDLEIISGVDRAFNHDLYICKIVGIILFCSGGCMVTGVLLGLLLTHTSRYDDPLSAEDIPLTGPDPDAGPGSAMDEKVPVTEELTAVQPKREDLDEVVMTNAGLCKIP